VPNRKSLITYLRDRQLALGLLAWTALAGTASAGHGWLWTGLRHGCFEPEGFALAFMVPNSSLWPIAQSWMDGSRYLSAMTFHLRSRIVGLDHRICVGVVALFAAWKEAVRPVKGAAWLA
jgi:hypothetical protein